MCSNERKEETRRVMSGQEVGPGPHPLLRGIFFPLVCPGHMIPLIDIAKLLSRRGVAVTVVTTPGNAGDARPSIDRANQSQPHTPIDLALLPFPSPPPPPLLRSENLSTLPNSLHPALFSALSSLRPSLKALCLRLRADFLVSDAVLVWTSHVAADLRIPHIVFHGPGAFLLCVHRAIEASLPLGIDPIQLDRLPHPLSLSPTEISEIFSFPELVRQMREAEDRSFGVVVNTFHELEPDYAEFFRSDRRAWFVGPVSLVNSTDAERKDRGRAAAAVQAVFDWLDGQPARSVVYACFGSLCRLGEAQAREVVAGLEESGQPFLWAAGLDWEGMEERGRGRVVSGWVPQAAVLGHVAVGAFLTHCGWNSTIEGMAAGVPLLTWPMMYDQFVNERMITEVVRVGVRVRKGAAAAGRVTVEELVVAVRRVMDGGDEAAGLRARAKEIAEMARAASRIGGSSYQDLDRMVDDLLGQRGLPHSSPA